MGLASASAGGTTRVRLTIALLAAAVAFLLALGPQDAAAACKGGEVRTDAGCKTREAAARDIRRIAKRFAHANDLRAAIIQINTKNRPLLTTSLGQSAPGIPATERMNFRIGAVGITYEINLLLQLRDQGVLSLDDPVSKWMPTLPNANQVTLRMLATLTSGYPDFLFANPAMDQAILADPTKQWTPEELLAGAFALPVVCAPGTCFHYAHTNFLLLSLIMQAATGTPTADLLRSHVLRPLGLRHTQSSEFPPIPRPFLQAYDAERGSYENSTGFSPSSTINGGVTMTGTIADVAKSARAMGTGALISKQSRRDMFSATPTPIPFASFNQNLFYGMGIVLSSGWRLQTWQLFGYLGAMGYLPKKDISIALVTTMGPKAAVQPVSFDELLFQRLADYLTPGRVPTFP
jgi:CubicO group peptidase (beta-lactamase class C family)